MSDASHARLVGASELIVLVDADAALADSACRMLASAGMRAHAVPSRAAALALLARSAIGVRALVLDVAVPEAQDLVADVRRSRPNLPIVATGAFSAAQLQRRFPRGQVDGYLPKPFTSTTLTTCLRALVR